MFRLGASYRVGVTSIIWFPHSPTRSMLSILIKEFYCITLLRYWKNGAYNYLVCKPSIRFPDLKHMATLTEKIILNLFYFMEHNVPAKKLPKKIVFREQRIILQIHLYHACLRINRAVLLFSFLFSFVFVCSFFCLFVFLFCFFLLFVFVFVFAFDF